MFQGTLKHGSTLMIAHCDSAKLNQSAHCVLNKNNNWKNTEWIERETERDCGLCLQGNDKDHCVRLQEDN